MDSAMAQPHGPPSREGDNDIPVAFIEESSTFLVMSLRSLVLIPLCALILGDLSVQAQDRSDPNGIYFQLAIYFAPEPKVDPLKEATAVFNKDFAKRLTYRNNIVRLTDGAYVEFREVKAEDYPPPKVEYLEHKGFGLSPEQGTALQKSKVVLVLDFFVVKPKDYDYLLAANELALAVAKASGGLIWDEETRELYSAEKWQAVRLSTEHFVYANTSMHAYQLPSKNYRTVTFGMRKLGAPDLMITEFTTPFWEPISEMMRFLVYQVAAPGPLQSKTSWSGAEMKLHLKLEAPAKDVPSLKLIPAPSEPGDPRNAMLTVDFLDYPGKTYEEKQAYAVDRFFEPEGGLMKVWREREQLMKLSEQARVTLKTKKELLVKGLADEEQLLVKAFDQDAYQWVRLQSWEGEGTLRGQTVPNVDSQGVVPPQEGKPVEINLDQVFDYLHIYPDGREEGNETGKLIRRLQTVVPAKPDQPGS